MIQTLQSIFIVANVGRWQRATILRTTRHTQSHSLERGHPALVTPRPLSWCAGQRPSRRAAGSHVRSLGDRQRLSDILKICALFVEAGKAFHCMVALPSASLFMMVFRWQMSRCFFSSCLVLCTLFLSRSASFLHLSSQLCIQACDLRFVICLVSQSWSCVS